MKRVMLLSVVLLAMEACGGSPPSEPPTYDVLIRNGTVYDGSGANGVRTDIGIRRDRVVAAGDLSAARAGTVVDASGLAVAPGFINVLSWATESLIEDGRPCAIRCEARRHAGSHGRGLVHGTAQSQDERRHEKEQGDIRFEIV